MPFPRAQSPSNPNNLHKKLGINSVCSDQSTREMKKVRVICSDPYATESSGDDETSEKPYVAKRIVRVVNIPLSVVNGPKDPESAVDGPKDPEIESSCQDSNNGEKASQKKSNARTKTRKPNEPQLKGIRKRAPGSWASEIRDPITKKRVWLGTFKSPEEASMAYERKKLEFVEALASAAAAAAAAPAVAPRGKRYTRSVSSVSVSRQTAVSGDSESLVSHTSPSSVLEIESLASASALIVNSRCNETVKTDESIDAEQKMHNSVGVVGVDEALVSEIGKGLDLEMELESFFINDFDQNHLLDDFCSLDDLQIDGFDDNDEPSDLPDFDFELGDGLSWFDDPPINMVQP